jgi:hypothetical protein
LTIDSSSSKREMSFHFVFVSPSISLNVFTIKSQ